MEDDQVVLVDQADNSIGQMGKIEAHQRGQLHRAFSILIFNQQGELLIQKRSSNKYHSAGLWANTCCSHPRPDETIQAAAHRRLAEEMGFDCHIREVTSFIYKTFFDNGLCEHELDHVLIGEYDGKIEPDANEVSEWKYISLDDLRVSLVRSPHLYTEWFKLIFSKFLSCPNFAFPD